MDLWGCISVALSKVLNRDLSVISHHAVAGGCINNSYRIKTNAGDFFVKTNGSEMEPMFAAEMEGLRELERSGSIRVPRSLISGLCGSHAYLILENMEMGGSGSEEELGRSIAQLHRYQGKEFGWQIDNCIGSTPQSNRPHSNWVTFYGRERLGYQLKLAQKRGAVKLVDLGEELIANLSLFFTSYQPVPSLLHGDLWSGNYSFLKGGEPVIFDPAVYYGDRESDIAMTEMFGGFSNTFYGAYNEAWPLDSGYSERKPLYILYHLLNHDHLFSGDYGRQAEQSIRQLLSTIR